MTQIRTFDRGLLRMGGLSALLAGVCILTFAILADSHGIFFFDAVYDGASIDPWLRNVLASPALSRVVMVLPVMGFSSMFILMRVLDRYIAADSWQKTLATSACAIGVPLAVLTFALQLSLMNIVLLHGTRPDTLAALESVATLQLYSFHVVNEFLGPLLIIVLGTAMMAWAALRALVLPRWLCIWLMTCGVMLLVSCLAPLVPAVSVLGVFAPLHMVGLVVLGGVLLRRSWA